MTDWSKMWPHGKTYVFQGTVLEDATAGTHICTLTVSPGAGNEFEFITGSIIVGNTATAQAPSISLTDGTNNLVDLLNPVRNTSTVALTMFIWPLGGGVPLTATYNAATALANVQPGLGIKVSGTMQLILRVSTTAVSVTQTFACVCRVLGGLPTATLADSVGVPTLTTNTNRFF